MKKTNATVSVEFHRRHMRSALADHNYFTVFRDLTLIMSITESAFLCDLIGRDDILHHRRNELLKQKKPNKAAKVNIDVEGYFRCTRKFLMNKRYPPVWTMKQQNVLFVKLKKKGFIKTKNVKNRERWVWIDYVRINLEIDKIDGILG